MRNQACHGIKVNTVPGPTPADRPGTLLVHAPGTVLQNHSDWQGSTLTDSIPILTYHRVHPDHETTVPDDQGRVNLGEFRRQMEYLVAQGVKTVTHHDLAGWLHGGEALPDRPVAIDFDDNRLNIFENAFPILQEHGFRATFMPTRR